MTHVARVSRSPLVLAVVVVGVLATGLAAASLRTRAEQNAAAWITERAEVVLEEILDTVEDLVAGVDAVSAFLETSGEVSQETFEAFVSRLDPRISTIGVAYLPIVHQTELDAFVEEMRGRWPDFTINDLDPFTGQIVPLAAERQTYYPVQFFAPGDFLIGALPVEDSPLELGVGVDAASNATWAASMVQAFETETPIVSNFIPIEYEDIDIGQAFLVIAPVTTAAEGTVPTGAVAAPMIDWLLPTNDLAASMTKDVEWDVSPAGGPLPVIDPAEEWVGILQLSGTSWQLSVNPNESARAALAGTPSWLVWLIGLTLTAVVAGFVQMLRLRSRSKARMRQLQRLSEEKDRFLAAVSHEIRTPLTAVAGLAHELNERPADFGGDETAQLLATVAEQSDEVAAIVDDLLVAARSDIDKMKVLSTDVDLWTAVERAIESARVDAVVVGAPPPTAMGDPQRVRQVLRNLLTNAARYGGELVEVRFSATPQWAVVTVADNGAPIPDPSRNDIFAPYTSAHEHGERLGSIGLGLFISRKLATLMQGHLDYDHDGTWSLFTLRLPVAVDKELTTDDAVPMSEPAAEQRGAAVA